MFNHNHFPLSSPLQTAIRDENIGEVKRLLDFKADPNECPTAEMQRLSSKAICHYLFQPFSWPLIEAVFRNSLEIVQLLLDAKADIEKQDAAYHKTAIWYVQSAAVLKILIEAKAKIGYTLHNIAANDGISLLYGKIGRITSTEKIDIMRVLLHHKASVSIQDERSRTPLSYAVGVCDCESIQLLLSHKADVLEKTAKGKNLIDVAGADIRVPYERKLNNTIELLKTEMTRMHKAQQSVAIFAGLHNRAGAHSLFTNVAKISPLFDRQVFRRVLKLAGAKTAEQANTRAKRKCQDGH